MVLCFSNKFEKAPRALSKGLGIALAMLLGVATAHGTTTSFTTAGNSTWTCPAGVTNVQVEVYGGGGGGGGVGKDYNVGGGGAGGSYVRYTVPANSNTVYKLTVGAGGTAGAGNSGPSNGGTGGSSYFGNTTAGSPSGASALAVGGPGGALNNDSGGTSGDYAGGAAGGVATTTGNVPGSGAAANTAGTSGGTSSGPNGGPNSSGAGGAGAGPSGSTGGGAGGASLTSGAVSGNNGTAPGGGASGGYRGNSNSNGSGGAGGAGRVVLTYTAVPIISAAPTASAITYGQTLASSTLSGGSAVIGGSSVAGSFAFTTPSTAPTSAGTAAQNVTFTPSDLTTYSPVTFTINVTVNQKVLTVTGASVTSKAYNGLTAATITGATLSGVINGDSVTLGSATSGTFSDANVGTGKSVTTSMSISGSGSGNYTLTQPTLTGNITAASLTVTATGPTKSYGTALTTGTSSINFTTSATQNGETVTSVTLTPNAAGLSATTAAGAAYTVTPSAATGTAGFSASNYSITYVAYNGTVSQAPLTVTATGPTKAYGTALTAGTSSINFTASATQNGETVTSVTLTPNAAGLSATTAAGAAYTVTPSAATGTGGFLASNYSITYIAYNGTVGQAALTITANDVTKTYGTALAGGSGSMAFTSSALQNGETLSTVTIAYGTGSAATAAVGTYNGSVTPSAAVGANGFQAFNYSITYTPGKITVQAAALTVTATGPTKTYGTALSAGTSGINFTTSATQNSETVTNVTLTPNAAGLSATTAAGAGYTVTPSAATGSGGFLASNYSITYVAYNSTVTQAPLTVTATGPTKTYGTALTAGTSGINFTTSAAQNVEAVTSVTLTPNAAGLSATTAAGAAYVVTPSAATGSGGFLAANYSITYVAYNGTVGQAPLTITADNATKCAGNTLTFTGTEFSSVGLKNGETIGSVTLSSSGSGSGAAAGGYSIIPSAATGGSFTAANYSISYVNGTLTVTALSVSTPSSATKCECESVTFSVTPSGGTGPYTYQWKKNGANIGSATGSSYTINSVTAASAASYNCSVVDSSTGCTGASASGVLTVNSGCVPNSWLSAHGLSNGSDPNATYPGGNGMTLLNSWLAGLDPTDPNSTFAVSNTIVDDSLFTLTWKSDQDGSAPVRLYDIYTVTGEFSSMSGSSRIASNIAPAGTTTSYQDDVSGNNYKYYRVTIAGTTNVVTSEVVGAQKVSLVEGRNYVSLAMAPSPATLLSVLGTNQLPAGAFESSSTTVDIWDQTGQQFTNINRYWLSSTGAWKQSNTGASGNGTALSTGKGMAITIRNPQGPQTIYLGGFVPVSNQVQTVQNNGYSVVGSGFPKTIALGNAGLVGSGFVGGSSLATSDQLMFFNPATQNFDFKVWYDSTGGVWRNANGSVTSIQLTPGEAFLIKRRNRSGNLIWTNSTPYTTPLVGP